MFSPPFTSPFVLMADSDNVVSTQTNAEIPMMMSDWTARENAQI